MNAKAHTRYILRWSQDNQEAKQKSNLEKLHVQNCNDGQLLMTETKHVYDASNLVSYGF